MTTVVLLGLALLAGLVPTFATGKDPQRSARTDAHDAPAGDGAPGDLVIGHAASIPPAAAQASGPAAPPPPGRSEPTSVTAGFEVQVRAAVAATS